MPAEYFILKDGLAVVLTDPLCRSVGGKNKERGVAEIGFRYCGGKVVSGRSRSAHNNDRFVQCLGHAERYKACAAFVAESPGFNRRVPRKSKGQRRAAGTRTQYGIAYSMAGGNFGDIINRLVMHQSMILSSVLSFISVSSHSFSGSESAVTPAPAYKIPSSPRTCIHRRFTNNSILLLILTAPR